MLSRILDWWSYFFRHSPDTEPFASWSWPHWTMLIVAGLGIIFIISHFFALTNKRKLTKRVAYILATQQAILYGWYVLADNFNPAEGLPLFNCRVAIIASIIALLTDNKMAKMISVYWGIFGSIMALTVLGLDPYTFPHWTSISYFIGHILLLWTAIYFWLDNPAIFNRQNLKRILIFTNIYHLLVFPINLILHSNYCYLNSSPISLGTNWNQILYTISSMLVFNFCILAVHFISQKLPRPTAK